MLATNREVSLEIEPIQQYQAPPDRPYQMAWQDDTSSTTHVGAYYRIPTDEPQEYWSKIIIATLVGILDDISGKATKALMVVLDLFVKANGYVFITQEELAKRAGCSRATMNKVMGVLTKHNIIVSQAHGVYSLNPTFIFQGNDRQRFDTLLLQFVEKTGTSQLPDAPNAASMTKTRALLGGTPTDEDVRSALDVPLPF